MSISNRNRRKIHVRGQLFLWWLSDSSDHEGYWILNVIADDDKRLRFQYDLNESGLADGVRRGTTAPLPGGYDRETLSLTNPAVTRDIGADRHAVATPSFVRRLIEWHFDNVW